MTFQGAVIREQGVTFAVVIVKMHVIDSSNEAGRAIAAFQPVFPGLPVVLMAQDYRARRCTTVAGTSPSSDAAPALFSGPPAGPPERVGLSGWPRGACIIPAGAVQLPGWPGPVSAPWRTHLTS